MSDDKDDPSIATENGTQNVLLSGIRKLARFARLGRNGTQSARDTIEELIDERMEDEVEIDAGERAMIRNILGLRDIVAKDVMVPRADIIGVDAESSLPEVASQMIEAAHSRLPVYRETLDNAIGMVHIKDVMAHRDAAQALPLTAMIRKVLFVSPAMRALELLQEMRLNRQHLALVIDEYGGIDGLITIEDLVEEIVGEIDDEHDTVDGPKLQLRPGGGYWADPRATVEEFEALIGPVLSDEEREEIDTLGGLVLTIAGRVPGPGEVFNHPAGIRFEIVDSDPRRIKALQIHRTAQTIDT
jgi:CBS domain containing-hemolysin-like protein